MDIVKMKNEIKFLNLKWRHGVRAVCNRKLKEIIFYSYIYFIL